MRALLALLVCVVTGCVVDSGDVATDEDLDAALCAEINAYRNAHGLAPVAVSPSLAMVARLHAEDLGANGTGGASCNLHSWTSGDSRWSGCCYTDDHAQAECMWDKPGEISGYEAPGFEIAARVGSRITPAMAVSLWDESESHRMVMANDADFADTSWRGMGCAIENGYAVVWFGELAAP